MKLNLLPFIILLFSISASADDFSNSVLRGSAKSFYCTSCHGYHGMGTHNVPAIAGQDENKLLSVLKLAKARPTSIKGTVLERFGADDLVDLSRYFSSLESTPAGIVSYKRDIQPLIQYRCVSCHSPAGEGANKSGLQLHTYEYLTSNSLSGGRLIIPGSPETSTFMVMLTRNDHLRMPFGKPPLPDDEISVIRKWIGQGVLDN